jgi:DNA-binding NtrC family response regulator
MSWAMTGGIMAKVLLVGYIAELLQERERTLRAAGYQVMVSPSFATASTAVAQELFDVAVLGFSVPENERNHLARAIKQANPSAKIIMIYFDSIKNTELADAIIPTTAGPDEILRAVHHILTSQSESQPG